MGLCFKLYYSKDSNIIAIRHNLDGLAEFSKALKGSNGADWQVCHQKQLTYLI